MLYNEVIRTLRIDSDKTQEELAKVIYVSQRTYSDYESGRIRIPVNALIEIAKYYNVDMNYICGVSDERKPFPQK